MKIFYFFAIICFPLLFTSFAKPHQAYGTVGKPDPDTDSLNKYIYCGGLYFTNGKKGLYYSDDQCKSWKKQSNFPDVKAIKISSRDSELFVMTDLYGLYYSMDCGKTWESIDRIFEPDDGMSGFLETKPQKVNWLIMPDQNIKPISCPGTFGVININ